MHCERPRCRLLQVGTVVSGPCGSFSVRADLQNGIKTAPNKTAAAAKNNIHLLFNLKCQLAKQAVALQPKCALEESQLARLPRARKASYRDTGRVISSEFRSSEFTWTRSFKSDLEGNPHQMPVQWMTVNPRWPCPSGFFIVCKLAIKHAEKIPTHPTQILPSWLSGDLKGAKAHLAALFLF